MSLTYPLDTTGSAVSNLITGEQHSVTEANYRDYFYIVPQFAPFYANNFQLVLTLDDGTVKTLVEGEDYALALMYVGATRSIGSPIYGAVTLNTIYRTGILTVRYQTLGGDTTTDAVTILANLAELIYNPRTTYWDVVTNKPSYFPPITHTQSLDNFYDEGDLITSLNGITAAIANRPAPIISLSNATVQNPTVDYYSIAVDQWDVYGDENFTIKVFCDGTVVQPKDLYWTIWNVTTSDANFSAVGAQIQVNPFGGEWMGSALVVPTNNGTDVLEFYLQLRVGSLTGQIVAMTETIRLNPKRVTVIAGSQVVLVPEGVTPGLAFKDALTTGLRSLTGNDLSLLINGNPVSTWNETVVNGTPVLSQNLYYGPNGMYSIQLGGDGVIGVYSNSSLVLSFNDIATQSYVTNSINTAITNLTTYVDNNLQVSSSNITGVMSIAQGGTAATTAAQALINLGAYPASNPNSYIRANQAPVQSVAGKTGAVLLNATDITGLPTKLSQFTNDQLFITAAQAPVQSVAGRTGNVVLTVADVSGLSTVAVTNKYSDLTGIPTKLSQFTNDTNFITALQAPVLSVAGRTGSVSLTVNDIFGIANVAITASYNDLLNKPFIPTNVSSLVNDTGYITAAGTSSMSGGIVGGSANEIVFQTATSVTGFIPAGIVGQILSVSATGVPHWIDTTTITLANAQIVSGLGYTPADSALLGIANGIATLDSAGKVPAVQLPSYVDDVLEFSGLTNFPTTGETGKIYVDTGTTGSTTAGDPNFYDTYLVKNDGTLLLAWPDFGYNGADPVGGYNGAMTHRISETDAISITSPSTLKRTALKFRFETDTVIRIYVDAAQSSGPNWTYAGAVAEADINTTMSLTEIQAGGYIELTVNATTPYIVFKPSYPSDTLIQIEVRPYAMGVNDGTGNIINAELAPMTASGRGPAFAPNIIYTPPTVSNKTYRWTGSTYVEISASPGSTDAVPEGIVNLYYTTARAQADSLVRSVAGMGGDVVLTQANIGGLTTTDSPTFAAVTAVNFHGIADHATSLSGGAGGSIPYQTAADTTAFLAAGTANYVLQTKGPGVAPVWVNGSSLAPVQSVAGKTGTVTLSQADIAGLTSTSSPTFSTVTAATFTGALVGNANTATTATNLAGGTVGSIPYQNGVGVTAFLGAGTSGYVLATQGGGLPPMWVNLNTSAPVTSVAGRTGAVVLAQADIAGLTTTSSPTFTAVTATTFTGALVGNATSATNIAGGALYAVPYQTGSGATAFLNPGISGYVLQTKGNTAAPAWVNAATLAPVQSVAGRTGAVVLSAGDISGLSTVATTGSYTDLLNKPTIPAAVSQLTNDLGYLTSSDVNYPVTSVAGRTGAVTLSQADIGGLTTASSPTFAAVTAATFTGALVGNASTATRTTNLASGLAGSLPYQTAANTTTFLNIGSTGQILTVSGTGAPTWTSQSALVLTASQITTALTFTPADNAKVGVANGIATLDSSGKLTTSQIPSSLVGAVQYQGTWNASTNTPALASGVGVKGYYYKVNTAGTVSIDGNARWDIGDVIIFNGTTWDKLDGPGSEVTSVAGRIGDVVLTQADISGLTTTSSPTFSAVTATTFTGALTGNASTATSLAGGTANSIHYQSAAGVSAFLAAGTSGYVLQTKGTGAAPTWVNAATLAPVQSVAGRTGAVVLAQADISGLTTTSSPTFSAVTATTFTGALVGNANTATSLAGGTVYSIPYQSAVGTTAFLAAGTSGYVLQTKGTGAVPVWVNAATLAPVQSVAGRTGAVVLAQADISGLTTTSSPTFAAVTATTFTGGLVGNATSATNIAGGAAYSIPYQSAAGTTSFLGAGTSGYILQTNGTGTAPSWVSAASLQAVTSVAGRTGAVVLAQADISGLTTTSSPTFAAVTATTFTGSLSGNATTATTATYLSATQQVNIITGKQQSMAMSQDGTANGSFTCRASGTGDANLAGMVFWNDNYAIKMGIRADGYFGLGGWSRAAWSLYSDPSGNLVAAGNVTAYSDPRLKDNVETIQNPLDILESINGVTFTWNGRSKLIANKTGQRDYGILADQVKAVMPEIVTSSIRDEENGETYDTVSYEKLVPVLIEAIKELRKEIEILKKK